MDLFGLPPTSRTTKQLFLTEGTWIAPRSSSMAYILAVGGGGGGGAGYSSSAGTNKGGGGGGAASGFTTAMVPIAAVGDSLHIVIGKGGAGGSTSGSPGSTGRPSYVLARSVKDSSYNAVVLSARVNSDGGSAGTSSASGAGGSNSTTSYMPHLCVCGLTRYVTGTNGGNGGGAFGQHGFPAGVGSITIGGNGGAGAGSSLNSTYYSAVTNTDYADGIYRERFPIDLSTYTLTGPDGILNGLIPSAAFGGGANNSIAGGKGGDGALGCGGGGGGAGANFGGGGAGGKGGDGYVIIWSW